MQLSSSTERVSLSSPTSANRQIRERTVQTLRRYSAVPREAIGERLDEIDHEWDIERVLEANAASFALLGVVLAGTIDKKWIALSGLVGGLLLQHALQGWCPPLPIFRGLGYGTPYEIDSERFALRILRGDFDDICGRLHQGLDVDELYSTVAETTAGPSRVV